MKRLTLVFTLALALSAGLVLPAAAEEDEGVSVGLTVPYFTKYMSRGFLTVDDPVLQPGATLGYKGFTFNVWGNYNLTDKIGRKDKFTEVDLTAEYAWTFGDFTVPVGVIHYLFPNMSQPSTTEVYAGVSYKWIVTPALKVYHDVGDQHGTYVTLSLAHELELPPPAKDFTWALALQLMGGWGNADFCKYEYNWGVDSAHFTDMLLTVGLPIKYKDVLTVTPSFNQVWLMDSAMSDAAGWSSQNFWGLVLTFTF